MYIYIYVYIYTYMYIYVYIYIYKFIYDYNNAMRILLNRPRWSSASEMFVAAGVNTFQAVLRNRMYKFICRVDDSKNSIIMVLSNIKFSTTPYQSQLWRHRYNFLFIKHS